MVTDCCCSHLCLGFKCILHLLIFKEIQHQRRKVHLSFKACLHCPLPLHRSPICNTSAAVGGTSPTRYYQSGRCENNRSGRPPTKTFSCPSTTSRTVYTQLFGSLPPREYHLLTPTSCWLLRSGRGSDASRCHRSFQLPAPVASVSARKG